MPWTCHACTYFNEEDDFLACIMCSTERRMLDAKAVHMRTTRSMARQDQKSAAAATVRRVRNETQRRTADVREDTTDDIETPSSPMSSTESVDDEIVYIGTSTARKSIEISPAISMGTSARSAARPANASTKRDQERALGKSKERTSSVVKRISGTPKSSRTKRSSMRRHQGKQNIHKLPRRAVIVTSVGVVPFESDDEEDDEDWSPTLMKRRQPRDRVRKSKRRWNGTVSARADQDETGVERSASSKGRQDSRKRQKRTSTQKSGDVSSSDNVSAEKRERCRRILETKYDIERSRAAAIENAFFEEHGNHERYMPAIKTFLMDIKRASDVIEKTTDTAQRSNAQAYIDNVRSPSFPAESILTLSLVSEEERRRRAFERLRHQSQWEMDENGEFIHNAHVPKLA